MGAPRGKGDSEPACLSPASGRAPPAQRRAGLEAVAEEGEREIAVAQPAPATGRPEAPRVGGARQIEGDQAGRGRPEHQLEVLRIAALLAPFALWQLPDAAPHLAARLGALGSAQVGAVLLVGVLGVLAVSLLRYLLISLFSPSR